MTNMMYIMAVAVLATTATLASAAGIDAESTTDMLLERRHNLGDHHQKGRNSKKAPVANEQSRVLKRNREPVLTSHNGHPMLQGMVMTAAKKPPSSVMAKSEKAVPGSGGKGFNAKSPSNGEVPSSPGKAPSRGPKSNKGNPIGSKSRKGTNVICAKRLDIAFEDIQVLGPNGPFGLIETPSDVTDLCAFFPPDEGEPPNFGCPVLYAPDVGFVSGDEYEEVLSPPEAASAFESLELYCNCYSGLELGCAAKIPHGPPTSSKVYEYVTSDGEQVTKEVIVPGFSEYIPASTPGERAEYCKMVGVWNGDFPPEVADDLSDEVEMCGCYFIGQAQEMVDQCPGVDLGAFFQFPEVRV